MGTPDTTEDTIATITSNEFQIVAENKSRVVYGWGEEEVSVPLDVDRYEATRRSGARNHLIYDYAHAIPNEEAIATLVDLSPVVELGAGGGYWAHLVREAGGEVVALDVEPENNEYASQRWTRVQYGDEHAIRGYTDHTLFLCWPLGDATAEYALTNFPGDTVAYVGEHEGGCCASPGFFALLDRDYELVKTVDIPRFWGMTDYMSVWRRR